MPELVSVIGLEVIQQIRVIINRIFLASGYTGIEAHIIGMGIQQNHSTLLGDPVELPLPYVNTSLLENHIQKMILWQGVGQFEITTKLGSLEAGMLGGVLTTRISVNPEGENRSSSIRQ